MSRIVTRSGSITFPAFLNLMARTIKIDETEKEILSAFKVFDKDEDGYIDVTDFRNMMLSRGDEMNQEEVDEMIRDIDPEGTGKINGEVGNHRSSENAIRMENKPLEGKIIKYFPTELKVTAKGRLLMAYRRPGIQVKDLANFSEEESPRPTEVLQRYVATRANPEMIEGLQMEDGAYFTYSPKMTSLCTKTEKGQMFEIKGKEVKIYSSPPFSKLFRQKNVELHESVLSIEIQNTELLEKMEKTLA
ncbi:hypothetical protein CHS0354_007761 [Potamilus streckersoni]|uniref:EF-hand domain-containing protein n=1 Tax=Potamilus streckersoni TaxID=2493646 RepID=A0AAE0RS00_9BIVA|nr:hypothetical protein CHS0354_007761 [Potamilus streckersoni]